MSKKPSTTHTVDMAQIAELNDRLRNGQGGDQVSASDLGLDGAAVAGSSHGPLAGSAVLTRVCWEGAPEFPDIHGHFAENAGGDGALVVELHTAALRDLSHRLHARHIWGQGSIVDAPRR